MNILISNDDGILAHGIEVLEDVCREVGTVTVVAPDREQSATSHSLTMFRPLRLEQREERRYQVDGTPTDCILLALGVLFKERPRFVFSGINHGPNMGEDVLYSGTVAAAMEGLSAGVPGIAVSFAGRDTDLIDSHRGWLRRIVSSIVSTDPFPQEIILNINLPPIPGDGVKGIKVTTLGRRVYSDSLTRMKDPWGRDTYWIGGGTSNWTGGEDSDFRAVREGYISITPLHVDLTNYALLEEVRSWRLGG